VLITSKPPSGSAHADNFFSSIGTLCQRNDTINSVPPLADAVTATCATSAASQAGNPMSATSEAGGTYSVTVASGYVTTVSTVGSVSATGNGEAGVGPPYDGAIARSDHFFRIPFEVVGADVDVTLAGRVAGAVPDPTSNTAGFATVTIEKLSRDGTAPFDPVTYMAGRTSDNASLQPPVNIGTTLRLSPGEYFLTVIADASAWTDFDHASATASADYLLTLTVAP